MTDPSGSLIVRYASSGQVRVGVLTGGEVRPVPGVESMAALLALSLAEARAAVLAAAGEAPVPVAEVRLLPPVDGLTEVWASGVTYERSMDARVEESQTQDVYSRVYAAERPELFFKSVAWRVVTDGEQIAVRPDCAVTVPEPELAAVVTATAEVLGYTVCNDVSSRDIEGENPLYLPQAKIYAGQLRAGRGHPAGVGGARPGRAGDRDPRDPGRRDGLRGDDVHRAHAPFGRRAGRASGAGAGLPRRRGAVHRHRHRARPRLQPPRAATSST